MHIWEGLYRSFAEAPVVGKGHDGDVWASKSLEKIRALIHSVEDAKFIPPEPAYSASLLPLLASITVQRSGKVRILDFGGGPGFTYVSAIAGMTNPGIIDYHIVETAVICEIGSKVFEGDERIHFHSSLPDRLEQLDIVHLGSALHYIDDWRALLRQLAAYGPSYFMFTDLPAGDIPTYVTAQNYYGSRIPVRFFNFQELCDAMAGNDYCLQFKSRFRGTYFGKLQDLPQDNFPEGLRLGDTCSLLFSRSANG